jgi:hypothetical protein
MKYAESIESVQNRIEFVLKHNGKRRQSNDCTRPAFVTANGTGLAKNLPGHTLSVSGLSADDEKTKRLELTVG